MNTRFNPGRRHALAALGAAAAWPWLAQAQQNAGPYVPTPWLIVDEMLKLADIRADDFVVDLGSGDGRLVISAAERFGARGYGVDINPELVKLANENAAKAGVAARVRFEERDLFETRLAEATVLTLYLLPHTVTQLVPRILAEMKPGARVVSHDYPLGPLQPDRHLQFDTRGEGRDQRHHAHGALSLHRARARGRRLDARAAAGARGASPCESRSSSSRPACSERRPSAAPATPLEKLVVRGEAVSFAIPNLSRRGQSVRFSGKARGDVIEGVVALPGGEAPWRATRAAAKN